MIRKIIDNAYIKDAGFLAGLVALFCLKFYNDNFIFQGDVTLNLYMHGNPQLFADGWDPYSLFYLGWYPVFGMMFPLNALMHLAIQALGNDPTTVLHLLQVNAAISLFLLAFFTYLFFRYLQVGRIGSIMGGIIMISTGFHIQTSMLEFDLFYLHSFMFVPLVLMFLSKALKDKKPAWLVAAGFALGLSLLGGGNVPMFMYIPIMPMTIFMVKPIKDAISWRMLRRGLLYTAATSLIGVVVGAAMVLPSLMNMQYSARDVLLNSTILNRAISPPLSNSLYTMLFRDWWISNAQLPYLFHEFDSFLGIVAVIFMLVGLLRASTRIRPALFMMFLMLYGVALMHIAYIPETLALPIEFYLKKASIRLPYRFAMVLLLPVAYFAAIGMETILSTKPSYRERILIYILGPISVFSYAYQLWHYSSHTMTIQAQQGVLIAHTILFIMIMTVLCVRYSERWYHLSSNQLLNHTLLLCVFLFYLFLRPQALSTSCYNERDLNNDKEWKWYQDQTVQKSLTTYFWQPSQSWQTIKTQDQSPFRIINQLPLRHGNIWAPKFKTDIAFEPYNQEPASPYYYYKLINMVDDIERSSIIDLLNIKYIFSPDYDGTRFQKTNIPGIVRNPKALERYFIVHDASFFANDDELLQTMINQPSETFKRYAFMVQPQRAGYTIHAQSAINDDKIVIKLREPTQILIDAKTASPGFLIALEPWMPLWKVFLDGKEVDLLRADSAFWGVALTAGSHQVEFRFRDQYAIIGKLITEFCMFFGVIILFTYKFKKTD